MDRSVDLDLLRACSWRGILPAPPTAIRRALDLAGDECTNSDVLTDRIDSDPRLHFGFLTGANLPMFCGNRPIKTVRQGVGELGRRKTVSLLWLVALSDFLLSARKREGRDRLWRHSLLTGVLAHQLVLAAGFRDLGDALTAGLAHDVGHLLLAYQTPRLGIAVDEEPGNEEHDRLLEDDISLAPERDHCQLGASLLDFWSAPKELVSSALYHHNPEISPAGYRPLMIGVRLADLLAEHLDLDRPTQVLRLEAVSAWQQLAAMEPWNQVANLHDLALEQLPDSLVTAEHLGRVLGG